MKYCVILTLAKEVDGHWQAPPPEEAKCIPLEFDSFNMPTSKQLGRIIEKAVIYLSTAEAQTREASNKK
jgi:hypothetical protein